MGDYGLKITNDNGAIQIDSTYVNFVLYEWGTSIVVSGTGTAINFSNNTKEPPLIALQPESTVFCGVASYLTSGELYTGFVLIQPENSSATVNVMVFVARTDGSGEQYGLKVYNTGGNLVYDSGFNSMIIQDVDTVSPAYTDTAQIIHPSNANAYFIMTPDGYKQHWVGYDPPVGSDGWYYKPMFKKVDNTTVSFGGRIILTPHVPGYINGDYAYWPSSFTILTVKKAF